MTHQAFITLSSKTKKYVIIIGVIVIICLIIMMFDSYHRSNINYLYTQGEEPKKIIISAKSITLEHKMKPEDNYKVGSTYLVHYNDKKNATNNFKTALNKLADDVDNPNYNFIVDGIMDYKSELPNRELDILLTKAVVEQYDRANNMFIKTQQERPPAVEIKTTETTQTNIEAPHTEITPVVRPLVVHHWTPDSQNVHDSNVMNDFKQQYDKCMSSIAEYKINDKHNGLDAYDSAKNWILNKYQGKKAHDKVNKVFGILDNNYAIPGTQLREKDVLGIVWARAHDPRNAANKESMLDSMAESVLDCHEGSSVVCLGGRTPKIWQSLARLDFDKDMGVMKTKQLIRAEIYDECAKILRNNLDSASEEVRKNYNEGKETEEVKSMVQNIHKQIDNLSATYHDKLPDLQLQTALLECKSAV
jgi:hypothetical protein